MNLQNQIFSAIYNLLNLPQKAVQGVTNMLPQQQTPQGTPPPQTFSPQSMQIPGFYNWVRANPQFAQGQNNQQLQNFYQNAVNSPGGHPYGTTPTPQAIPVQVRQQPQASPQSVLGSQSPNQSTSPNITIPYSQGGKYTLPAAVAQILLNAFNSSGQATNAAQVLNHPRSQTYTPQEIQQFGHPSTNYGENASFKYVGDTTNSDGSTDRGLFRINSNTFNGYMQNPTSRQQLANMGITSYDDMNDPQKNANFAALLQNNSGWGRWFAAPLSLKNQGNNLAQQ